MSDGRDPRREAERLVGTALGALSMAAQATAGFGPGGECCVCPICRLLVKMRDPSPEFAERLADAAGDLAVGAAALLRAFATLGGDHDTAADPAGGPGADPSGSTDRPAAGGPESDHADIPST